MISFSIHDFKERKKVATKGSDSESDFGDDDDDDEDSDEDYEEAGTLKPWQRKAQEAKKKKTTSRLDDLDEEDEEEELRRAHKTGSKTVKPAELEDYLLITISRARLGTWCNEPYFEKAVFNCFVKLFVGENEEGKRCYRLCRIVRVDSAVKPYSLPAVRKQKPIKTDKMLELEFAGTKKLFPLRLVSDAKITQSDLTQYETAMKTARKQDELVGKLEAIKIRKKRDELVENFTYTTEDIEKKLKDKKLKSQSTANLGLEQTVAANAIQAALGALENANMRVQDAKDKTEESDAKSDLKAAKEYLELRREEEMQVLEKVKKRQERNKNRSNRWVDVNLRAIKMNQQTDFGLNKSKGNSMKSSPSGKVAFNPYARRKVKPKNLWQVGQGDEKAEGDEKKDPEVALKTKDGKGQSNGNVHATSTPPLVQEQQGKAAAVSQSHQFSIDEETLAQTSFLSGIGSLTSKKNTKIRVRKGLSLAEYLKRKAGGTL